MKFSIIINTHEQSKFIYDFIKSCKNQQASSFEVIIVDTSKSAIKKKELISKKIKYFHLAEKNKKFPVINQMYQILFGFKKSKGEFICLIDGDDKFNKFKIKKLSNLFKSKKHFLNQDVPIIFSNKYKKKQYIKKYKNNNLFKKTFIYWPQIFGTSSITCHRHILKRFFREGKPFNWEFLAIDTKLVLFSLIKFQIENKIENITLKRKHNRNLDKKFSNFFSKFFWIRRNMQHDYYYFLAKKKVYNLDYFITKLVNLFI